MDEMSAPIPCATCGWREEAHLFPELYPQCAHKYVPERHLIDINRREVKPDHEPE
jgi:hypothetical protein